MISIAVCIACHNRKLKTVSCLEHLFATTLPPGFQMVVHLFDDGSEDGTSQTVFDRFPQIRIHQGDGSHYWARGMRVAYGAALAEGHDFYIWLNDDVELFRDSLTRAIETYNVMKSRFGGEHLIAGAMRSSEGSTAYSGLTRSSSVLPWKFKQIAPSPNLPQECDTINGNFVLISSEIAIRLGNIRQEFIQMHADLVLGITARKKGIRIWIMPGFAGVCEANLVGRKNWTARGLNIRQRISLMHHPLGYPLRPSIAYACEFGIWAPVMIAAPYLKLLIVVFRDLFRH